MLKKAASPAYSSEAYSRSPSPIRLRSRSRSRSVRFEQPEHRSRKTSPSRTKTEDKADAVLKTSLVFLGAVGAATLAAHKLWPKGVIYGDKEEEHEEKEKKRERRDRTEVSDSGRKSHHRRSEDDLQRSRPRRYEDRPIQEQRLYETEYVATRPRSMDQRIFIETGRSPYPGDEREMFGVGQSRRSRRDEYDYRVEGKEPPHTGRPRPRVYLDDEPYVVGAPRVMAHGGDAYAEGYMIGARKYDILEGGYPVGNGPAAEDATLTAIETPASSPVSVATTSPPARTSPLLSFYSYALPKLIYFSLNQAIDCFKHHRRGNRRTTSTTAANVTPPGLQPPPADAANGG
ncbi:hypothetical protein GGR57DRAFT_496480 [Xylariaceae sp. FL1272]|nr:hypothetical protein GGR57DRAFT_496480 [Xylariaceae sp. FL1272]